MGRQVELVEAKVTVRILINDEDAITRVVDNDNGWRETFYKYTTRDEVLQHFAYNCIQSGIMRANRLDGWADMRADAVEIQIVEVDVGTCE